jgi:hypothetical protein
MVDEFLNFLFFVATFLVKLNSFDDQRKISGGQYLNSGIPLFG